MLTDDSSKDRTLWEIEDWAVEYEKLERRLGVLEVALSETFEDCYTANEFGELCENCERHARLLVDTSEPTA